MTTEEKYSMGDEFSTLDAATQAEVIMVVAMTTEDRRARSVQWRNGDIYAYPRANGDVTWGVNGGEHGFNIARGIAQKR